MKSTGWCGDFLILLFVVLGGGAVFRWAYYDGSHAHPDEPISFAVVQHMRCSGDWDTNWAKADLPPHFRYDQYNFSSYHYATFLFYRGMKLVPGAAALRSEGGGMRLYRLFSVLLAIGALGASAWLGARLGGRAVALGGAGLVALAPLLVQDAHYARPESFVTLLTLVAVGLCWPTERLRPGRLLGAGVVLGLLVACKVSMLLICWLPLVPVAAAWPTIEREGRVRRLGLLLGAIALACGTGFVLGAPGACLHPRAFLNGIHYLQQQYGHLHPPHSHADGGPVHDMALRYLGTTLGWGTLVAVIVGVVALAYRRRWAKLALVAGPVVCTVGYFGTRSVFFECNLSHVVPLGLVLAAYGVMTVVTWVSARLGRLELRPWLGFAVLLVLAACPGLVTARLLLLEYPGLGLERRQRVEQEVLQRYPGATVVEFTLCGDPTLDKLAAKIQAARAQGKSPIVIRQIDYNDEWSVRYSDRLAQRFAVEQIAENPTTFPEIPVCTLHAYFGAREVYFLLQEVR